MFKLISLKKQRGFSLIELIVAITIIAIIALLSVPSLQDYFANARLRSGADSLQAIINNATTEAVKRHTSVEVVVSSNSAIMRFDDSGTYKNLEQVTFDSQIKVTPSATLTFKSLRSVDGIPTTPFKFEPSTGSCPSGCPQVQVRPNGAAMTCTSGITTGYNACTN